MWFPVCEYDYAVWQTAEGRMQGQVQQTGRRSCIMRRRTGLSSCPGERWQEQDSSTSGKTQSHKKNQNASDLCGESCWHGAAEHCFQFKHTPDWRTAGATSLRSTKPGKISCQHDWLFLKTWGNTTCFIIHSSRFYLTLQASSWESCTQESHEMSFSFNLTFVF